MGCLFKHLICWRPDSSLLETSAPTTDNYSVAKLINDLKKGIFSDLKDKSQIDMYRRNIQKLYVDQLIELIKPDTS
jgi:hypothetical protein